MEKSIILKELKKISDFYLNKKDYISAGQINRAMDVAEDYYVEIEHSTKYDTNKSIDYRIELEE